MTRSRLCVAASTSLLLTALAPGCMGQFDGPYPCDPGYASCHGAGMGDNPGCETDVANDPQNCGACGSTCTTGAICADSLCGAPPVVLTTDANPEQIGIDSADVFYLSVQSGQLEGIPKGGGAAYTVALPGAQTFGTSSVGTPFAVDDTGVYYVAPSFSGPTAVFTVESVPPSGAPATPTTGATLVSSTGQGVLGSVSGMRLFGQTIFLFGDEQTMGPSQLGIWSASTTGSTASPVASLPSINGSFSAALVGIDADDLYVVASETQGCAIDRVPASGGAPSPLVVLDGSCPSAVATDGTWVYWAAPLSYDQDNGGQVCAATVYAVPVAGGSPSVLGQLPPGEAIGAMAVDGDDLYAVTSASVWRVPSAGATPVRIAGNLGAAIASQGGCASGNSQGSISASIATDDANVYVAVSSGLLKIPK